MGTNHKRKVRFVKQILILFIIVAAITGGIVFYVKWFNSGALLCGHFVDSSKSNTSPRLCFEVAETEGKRAKGLMFRKPHELAEHAGMIFVYPSEGLHSFWMKNTFIPLDMVFLDSRKKTIGVIENASPLTESSRKVDKPSQYIVELNAGSSKKWGIKAGTELILESELPLSEK